MLWLPLIVGFALMLIGFIDGVVADVRLYKAFRHVSEDSGTSTSLTVIRQKVQQAYNDMGTLPTCKVGMVMFLGSLAVKIVSVLVLQFPEWMR